MTQTTQPAAAEQHPPERPRRRGTNHMLVLLMTGLAIAVPAYNLMRATVFKTEIYLAQKDFSLAGASQPKPTLAPAHDPSVIYASALRTEAQQRIHTATLLLRTTFIPLWSSLALAAAALFCWYRGRPGARDALDGTARSGIEMSQLLACALSIALASGPMLQSERAARGIRGSAPRPSALELNRQSMAVSVAQERVKLLADLQAGVNKVEADTREQTIEHLTPLVFSPAFSGLTPGQKQPFAARLQKIAESVKADATMLNQILKVLDQFDGGATRNRLWATRFEWVDATSAQANEVALGLIQQRETEKLAAMLKRGLDPNSTRPDAERTLLYQAAWLGNVDAAKLLLDHGADPNRLSGTNADGRQMRPLHAASATGVTAMIDLLVGRRADVNLADSTGATPLHIAVARGVGRSIHALLRHDADVNRADSENKTPMDYLQSAQYSGGPAHRAAILELLTKRNARANVTAPANEGNSPAQGSLDVEK